MLLAPQSEGQDSVLRVVPNWLPGWYAQVRGQPKEGGQARVCGGLGLDPSPRGAPAAALSPAGVHTLALLCSCQGDPLLGEEPPKRMWVSASLGGGSASPALQGRADPAGCGSPLSRGGSACHASWLLCCQLALQADPASTPLPCLLCSPSGRRFAS